MLLGYHPQWSLIEWKLSMARRIDMFPTVRISSFYRMVNNFKNSPFLSGVGYVLQELGTITSSSTE